ncbi:MAG: HAD family phosphatase [archaeon]
MAKMKREIKVVAIDFSGVYFTWNQERHIDALSAATSSPRELVVKSFGKDLRELNLGKITDKQYWDSFCRNIGKNVSHKKLDRITQAQFKPIKTVMRLIAKLRRRHKIVLFTNQSLMLDRLNEKHGFYKNFDLVINSSKVGMRKPDREMFAHLLTETGAKPFEVLFIDDYAPNIEAAKKLGLNAILFTGYSDLVGEIKKAGISLD